MPKKEKVQLKQKRDGSFSITSKSLVRLADERLEQIEREIQSREEQVGIPALREERAGLVQARDKYIIDHFQAGEGYEDDSYKHTKVVSHTRKWDAEKLEKLVPRGIFKNLVTITVVPSKIDEYVRKGKLDRKKIERAFIETPNEPYVKTTKKTTSNGEEEAESLAAKLA
jgi:hypothetical protein